LQYIHPPPNPLLHKAGGAARIAIYFMSTALITGVAGFAGSHLADLLLYDSTTSVVGLLHPEHEIQHLADHPRFRIYREDILNWNRLAEVMKEVNPQVVYHLAGMAQVHESWTNRITTIETNFVGSLYLLEACRKLPVFPKVLLVGSAECYGIVPEKEQPISESRPLVPASPYALSKIAQESLGLQYALADKLPVYLTRSFNHTGPRQKESFVCSAFARQIAQAELNPQVNSLRVGNLSAKRDFSDVRDVVRAYRTIIERGIPGEAYNICSGAAVSITDILEMLLSQTTRKLNVEVDPEKFRPVDMPLLLGSCEKLSKQTGWTNQYKLQDTLKDLLDYWREKLKREVYSA
jgi:GDP-4-dehydro-6-deoxy-D-mannose reductase